MNKVVKLSVVGLFAVCTIFGCVTNPPPQSPSVVVDKSIARAIRVELPKVRYTPDNIMEISVMAQNLTGNILPVQYQVNYFDKDGHQIDTVLNRWNTVQAAEREIFYMQAVAPGQQAQDYRITIRKGK